MKILITGAKGQLGIALQRRFSGRELGHEVIALDRSVLDITSARACAQKLNELRPQLVLNCAAYTAVDRAEAEPEIAYAINAEGAKNLALACGASAAKLVHFSTDYVFDGTSDRAYIETDVTAPLGVYGASKLAGERLVLQSMSAAIVLRLSWVYSNDGANFYKTMLRLGSERSLLRVVDDQRGTPNFTGDIADAVAHIVRSEPASLSESSGVYHLSGTGITTWCGFARSIFSRAKLTSSPSVERITTDEYPTPAKRPAFSALDSSRFAATFGWVAPEWEPGLARCLAERVMSA